MINKLEILVLLIYVMYIELERTVKQVLRASTTLR